MEIREVGASEFAHVIPTPYHVYGSSSFAELNAEKAEKIFYLLFKDNKYRLGLIGGLKDNCFFTPFSAPFGGFVFLNAAIKIDLIDKAIQSLIEWAAIQEFSSVNFTLPPEIYHQQFIAKQSNSLYRHGFSISKVDLSYFFDLRNLNEQYYSHIWKNARNNLRAAVNNNLKFHKSGSLHENKLAYQIIEQNREQKGIPLRMSWTEIERTADLVDSDFFLVHNASNIPIAAAIIFHVKIGVVQVIYWGHLPEFNYSKAMNYLSFKVFEYYKNRRIEIVDIGPATDHSQPNYGLCAFKESIGCKITNKLSFTFDFLNRNQLA